jgi:hypothetical protein
MNNENEKGREHDLRQRIVSLIRANEQALKKPITDEEVQKLKAAAARLDQMLKAAVDADGQVLRSAAARLDQLLGDIAGGKDVTMTSSGDKTGKKKRGWLEISKVNECYRDISAPG